jgi:hypothetical protein
VAALEVKDVVEMYNELKSKNHSGTFVAKQAPISLDPFPYSFLYWIDKYGVQWEFEQGRPARSVLFCRWNHRIVERQTHINRSSMVFCSTSGDQILLCRVTNSN